jgi:Fic family protein
VPVFKGNIPATEPAIQSHQGGMLTPAAAEPFMPAEGTEVLENLAFDLAREASELSGQLHPLVRLSVADLVRSMNCYYSNLIEGHNTHPRDIDRALAADYSKDPHRRDLQLEARAHIEVQQMIDAGKVFPRPPAARAFIEWTHREFCARLPEKPSELQRRMDLYVRDEESAERLPKRSFAVLREALLSGELERGRVPGLIDVSERTARRVISALVEKRLLVSNSHKAPLRLGFPIDVVERWFPRLYPVAL